MPRFKPLREILPPLLLILSLSAVYLSTLAPGLTWAHDGSDGGDLISAAVTGGVPHPTGYPLYLILARAFQFLPVGNLAFRTNLLSACATVLAAGLVYVLAAGWSAGSRETYDWPAGLAAGYAFGLAPLIWSQALITEVYGLQSLLVTLILYLYTRPAAVSPSARARQDCWRGLALGLATGNHVTTILLVPAAVVLGSVDRQAQPDGASGPGRAWFADLRLDRGALLRQLGTFGAGLCLYLMIPLRAAANAPVNWGNAVTPERFWWLVSGQLYRSYYLQFSLLEVWERIQAAAAIFLQQFGLPGLVLGLVGLFLFGRCSRLVLLTTWMAVVFSAFALVYGSDDSYVYLMPVSLAFAIWIGHGLTGLSNQFARRFSLGRIALPLLLIGYLAARSVTQFARLDASADTQAESFGREVLSTAPENAILFATGDQAVFALWYFHFALGERPDVAVLAEDLLHFDWYQENLRATYPSLVLPGPFPWPESIARANPARITCYVRYEDPLELDCFQPVDLRTEE